MRSKLATVMIVVWSSVASADTQLWLQGRASIRPAKRVETDLSPQFRFDQGMSRFAAFLPELSVRYRVKRWLRVGSGYRFEYERNGDDMLITRHRFAADVRLRADLGDVRFEGRVMLVEQLRPDTRDPYRAVLRNRVDVSYRASRSWAPFAATEPFHLLGDFDEATYNKLRLTAGLVHHGKSQDLEMFVRAELQAEMVVPPSYIVGFGYHYEL